MRKRTSYETGLRSQRLSRRSLSKHLSFLSLLLLLSSCTSQDVPSSQLTISTNRPPWVKTVQILPTTVTADDLLSVRVEAEDPDRSTLTFKHRWFLNEILMTETPTLSGVSLKRGDRVAVEVVASDGAAVSSPLRTQPSVVVNAPPRITQVHVKPTTGFAERSIQAEVEAVDADRDAIRYRFRWWKSETLVQEGESDVMGISAFGPGDVLIAEVIPYDAEGQGPPFKSGPFIIGNSPPEILSSPSNAVNKGRYEYNVRAVDPEGKAVIFSLETAPPGMVINKVTGALIWEPPSQMKGTYGVKVVVEDNDGGSSSQEFTLVLG